MLHESISQADSSIAAGDERNRQQTQEANAAERALRHSIELSNRQIAEIDEQIRDIEKRLLQDAQVVATTLSKVFMDETLSKRRFDVVILDEVSMAPLPAVYVAASHADRSVVAIGDPRQLPPIALGDTRMVRRWLKRDLFSVAGVRVGAPANQADRRCVLLDTQFRMHADIAAVSNKHVYDGSLRNGNRPQQESNEYGSVRPLPGKAILLCDTSDASPVASQPGGSSRVNFYHAICSVTIAREVLATLPPSHEPAQAGQPRIGVVTPYKKQAQLIHRLLKAERLDTQIRVGTVHRFQGLEFEVIVFDTVESPPVNPFHGFIGGGRRSESNGMRLVNVAITRPQHKLIIVANQKYVRAKFSPSDTLLQAIIEVGDSASLLSRDLLGSAAPAIEQTGVLDHLRVVPARYQPYDIDWLDETTFFPRLLDDIRHAQKQILIFSPFVRSNRAADLIPHLAAQCLAGIRTVVVASQPGTNNVTLDESAKDQLVRAGVDFRTSPGMHEKLVRIDHDIVYFGSLNPLSHGATSEVMMRLVSAECALQVEQLLRVGVRTAQARYGSEFALSIDQFPQPINCPICGGAMWRRHGKYGAFYSHSRRVLCQQTREVQENDLGAIQQLANILCIGCRRGNMKARAEGKNLWLECAAPAPCDFRRKIVVHPSATPSMASGAP